jgi:hypothetical protein
MIRCSVAPTSGRRAVLGFQPRTALQDGLARTIVYFDDLLSERKPAHAPSASAALPATAAPADGN